jgi:LysR family hydrogen peroxide-inducible transcriptional activator
MTGLPSPQQLRYLVALAEHGHFGRAAAACDVTQSTLSAGILALERQLDATLLERNGTKRPVFTPLGRDLVARARAVLASLADFVDAVEAAREPLTGPLHLGIIPTIAPFLLPRLMPRLRQAFPRLRLFLREEPADRLAEALDAARLDLLLVALPSDMPEVEAIAIAEDPFLVALPADHPLAAQAAIQPGALAGERIMLLEEGHCLREHVLSACPGAGHLSMADFAATSLHTLVQMVAGGLGITLLPRLAVAGGVTAGTDLALRPLLGGFARRIGLAWRARNPRGEEFRAFAPVVAEALAEL